MQFIYNNLKLLSFLAVGASAVAFWFSIPEPAAPKAMAPVVETWPALKIERHDLKQAADTITARNLWGAVVPAQQLEQSGDPAWNFAGVARRGAERYVLIKVEGKPVQTLKIGDTLPGGAKILEIDQDRLCVLVNGKKRALGIYRQ